MILWRIASFARLSAALLIIVLTSGCGPKEIPRKPGRYL